MSKSVSFLCIIMFCTAILNPCFSIPNTKSDNSPMVSGEFVDTDNYLGQVTFPAGFVVGDYIEFLRVLPINTFSSGNYEISISYTRGNIAAAATYMASLSHANPDLWREVGRVNSNGYANLGSQGHNFTIDCNGRNTNPRFRIRAIATYGLVNSPLVVNIKVRSINVNSTWTVLNVTGNDLTVTKLQPMTNDWSLYVGNQYTSDGANVAIKALENGNVGIGTATPDSKLSVNGKIRAHEIKVETANWPDYVFKKDYRLASLDETELFISEQGHLPGIISAKEAEVNGVELGKINAKLLEKIEELTLYIIQQKKDLQETRDRYEERLSVLETKMDDRIKRLESQQH